MSPLSPQQRSLGPEYASRAVRAVNCAAVNGAQVMAGLSSAPQLCPSPFVSSEQNKRKDMSGMPAKRSAESPASLLLSSERYSTAVKLSKMPDGSVVNSLPDR